MKILLTTLKPPTNYVNALTALGAECTVADLQSKAEEFDGLLLCGGGDVEPALYNQPPNGCQGISPERDALELHFIHEFLTAGKPILGICRGLQILNVAFGGSLIRHLPNAEQHRAEEGDLTHPIKAEGLIKELFGEHPTVNSFHHQAADRLGQGFRAIAFAEDGTVEAIQHQSLPILGVQFHPERMQNGAPIFEWFISQIQLKKGL
ncbi:MAG: type 1 glutamine amidotransferase [Clostridia bacterium]|nr:type 1 glutamine amidotransferase [Clostridia bacterium]